MGRHGPASCRPYAVTASAWRCRQQRCKLALPPLRAACPSVMGHHMWTHVALKALPYSSVPSCFLLIYVWSAGLPYPLREGCRAAGHGQPHCFFIALHCRLQGTEDLVLSGCMHVAACQQCAADGCHGSARSPTALCVPYPFPSPSCNHFCSVCLVLVIEWRTCLRPTLCIHICARGPASAWVVREPYAPAVARQLQPLAASAGAAAGLQQQGVSSGRWVHGGTACHGGWVLCAVLCN